MLIRALKPPLNPSSLDTHVWQIGPNIGLLLSSSVNAVILVLYPISFCFFYHGSFLGLYKMPLGVSQDGVSIVIRV